MKTFVKFLSFMLVACCTLLLCMHWHDWSKLGWYVKEIAFLGLFISLLFLWVVSFSEKEKTDDSKLE